MKIRIATALASLTLLATLSGTGFSTTIGFVGSGTTNTSIPTNYGSNITGSPTGFTTTDGTGETPDVTLTWPGTNRWENHNSSQFAAIESVTVGGAFDAPGGSATAIAQLQALPLSINFSVPAGKQFILNSFDIGNAGDQGEPAYGWNITLVRDSDAATVASQTTSLFTAATAEKRTFNFVGDAGEDYTLNFTLTNGSTTLRSAIDNLSFSQQDEVLVPEPSTFALACIGMLATLGFGRRRRCRRR